MMAPRDPEICNHWLSWLVTVAIPIIIISNAYMGICLVLYTGPGAWKRSSIDAAKIFFIHIRMLAFVEVQSCFGVLFAAGALLETVEFLPVDLVKRCFCFPVFGILIINFTNPLGVCFRRLVNSGDGSLHILPVHCMEHIHCPFFLPLRYSTIHLVEDLVGSTIRVVCNHITLLNVYYLIVPL